MASCWQRGGCRGGCCGKRPGAAPCRTQSAPTEPLQGTAEPLSQTGATSGKTCLRKGTSKSQKRGGGTAPQQNRYLLQLMEEPTLDQISPAVHGAPHSGAQGYS